MTGHIDRDDVRRNAEWTIANCVDGIGAARDVLTLLDQLDAAEHRIARLEAQTAIRGRAVVMYRERARAAERLACPDRDVHWRYVEDIDACQERADQAEARIKAVRDVLDRHTHYGLVEADDIRRALDGSVTSPDAG